MKNCTPLTLTQKSCTPIFYVGVVITAVHFSTLTVPLWNKPNSLPRIKHKKSGKIIPTQLVRSQFCH